MVYSNGTNVGTSSSGDDDVNIVSGSSTDRIVEDVASSTNEARHHHSDVVNWTLVARNNRKAKP